MCESWQMRWRSLRRALLLVVQLLGALLPVLLPGLGSSTQLSRQAQRRLWLRLCAAAAVRIQLIHARQVPPSGRYTNRPMLVLHGVAWHLPAYWRQQIRFLRSYSSPVYSIPKILIIVKERSAMFAHGPTAILNPEEEIHSRILVCKTPLHRSKQRAAE